MGRTSNKREEILRFLTQFVAENGYAPSVREICAAVGLQSTATVHYHLGALREAGLIEMDDMKKRAITLPDAHRADRIPVVGVVTAGVPILAVENIEGYIPWEGEAGCFALRVRGMDLIRHPAEAELPRRAVNAAAARTEGAMTIIQHKCLPKQL